MIDFGLPLLIGYALLPFVFVLLSNYLFEKTEFADNIETWEENTVINLVYLLEGNLKIIFDCGYDDFFYQVNKELHQKLLENGVSHDYIERPGGHNWDYWSNAIKYHLVYFNDYFGG